MALHIKEEFPVLLKTKMENDEVEQQNSSYMESIESNVNIKPEEIDIKLEEFGYESAISIKKESQIEGDFNVVDNVKQESTDIDENQFEVKNEAWDIENQQTALTSTVIKSGSPVAVLSSNPEEGHTLGHQNTLENITSTFETSPQNFFETKRKGALIKHIKSHQKTKFRLNNSKKVLFKCEQCSYECKHLFRLHSHMLVHKDPSQLDMYECTECNFKTKYKKSLKDHSFLHKDLTELPSFKCNFCEYETKRKDNLRKHMGMHQKTSRPKKKPKNTTNSVKVLLKCEQCSYECKKPSRLRLHMRIHKDPSELNMYKCTKCNFKTKYSQSLKCHYVVHKDRAELPTYKCNNCGYETKRKDTLRKHIGQHRKNIQAEQIGTTETTKCEEFEEVLLKCE